MCEAVKFMYASSAIVVGKRALYLARGAMPCSHTCGAVWCRMARGGRCLPCGVTEFIVNTCMKPSRIHGAKATMNVRAVQVDQGS